MFALCAPAAPAQSSAPVQPFGIAESRITLWIVEGHH